MVHPLCDSGSGTGLADELAGGVAWLDGLDPAELQAVLADLDGTADNNPVTWMAVDAAGVEHRIGPTGIVVGRNVDAVGGSACLVVDHPLVSRRHIELRLAGAQFVATDLASRNGTWVRRGPTDVLDLPTELCDGDVLVTAHDVALARIVALPASAPADTATASTAQP